jgi:trehalose 6-phosphate phosphatase
MRYLFSEAGKKVIAEVSRGNALIAFDYDGTLAPIVDEPDRAVLGERTRALLSELALLYPCAVISGRARDDVAKRLEGVGLRAVVGNHGAEPLPGAALSVKVNDWRASLEPSLARFPGVEIEDKRLSLSVHYRRSADKDRVRGAILHATRLLTDARIVRGKQVVNVLPFGARHKGTALETIRRREHCDVALYVGDDDTDEDVFSLCKEHAVVGVRVGKKRRSLASHYVRERADVDRLIEELCRLRRAPLRLLAAP